jgi:hypothetical protein
MNMTSKYFLYLTLVSFLISCSIKGGSSGNKKEHVQGIKPVTETVIKPIKKEKFREDNCKQRVQGGNPRTVQDYLVFDGAQDGNRQVDPQIAVGGGYVFHATNSGLVIYDKKGNYIDGVSQNCFNKGIDPKLFFDTHNRIFVFDLWFPWDKEKIKPVSISVSATDNPSGAWNIYPVPSPKEVDGGAVGFSKKWIGYSFPGGENKTFVLKTAEAKAGKPATIYHFKGSLGHPVFTRDNIDDLYFFKIEEKEFVVTKVTEDESGKPVEIETGRAPHNLKYINWPPQSPQKGTDQLTASGDRNPKNVVLQNGYIWFSQVVNVDGRSAVQWHQVKLDGTIVQTGLISSKKSSYIQTTIAVNKNNDVLIGFQETSPEMFISPRMTYRKAEDPLGTTREIIHLGEGEGATHGVAWGDYSGSCIDGDNLTDLWTVQSITNKEGKGPCVIAKIPF